MVTRHAENESVIQEGEKALEEMMLDAEEAPEPGSRETVVNRPSADVPLPMTVGELSSAGWVYVWNQFTGDRSLCNRNTLGTQLLKRDEQGRRVFTTQDPGIRPARGNFLCMLHKDHPDRVFHDALGLPTCPAGHLRNEYNVRLHMQHRHRSEWAVLEDERRKQTEEEERQVRRAIIDRSTAPTPVPVETTPAYSKSCPECGKIITADSEAKLNRKLGSHKRYAHSKK